MDRTNQKTGAIGEKIASKFLCSRGYKILEKNFTTTFGEIDIVARKDDCIVFFEVKTRISERFGPPLSSITWQKQKHILKNCQSYISKNMIWDNICRIDVIGITMDKEYRLKILKHFKNAIILENDYS